MERNVVMIALFAALIAALGLIPKIDLASGIPITAQSMGIMLCGTVLGARRGALAVLLFLALVAMGLPLLAGGRGGLGVFTTPWAGFLFAFPIAAFAAGGAMTKLRNWPIQGAATIAALIGGIGVMYLIAVPYYKVMTGSAWIDAALVAMAPFMVGDLIKVFLTGFVTGAIAKARPNSLLSLQ